MLGVGGFEASTVAPRVCSALFQWLGELTVTTGLLVALAQGLNLSSQTWGLVFILAGAVAAVLVTVHVVDLTHHGYRSRWAGGLGDAFRVIGSGALLAGLSVSTLLLTRYLTGHPLNSQCYALNGCGRHGYVGDLEAAALIGAALGMLGACLQIRRTRRRAAEPAAGLA